MASASDPAFIVKICGITNEEDARTAVDAGANALGFNFYPKSPRFVTPRRAHRISAAVPGRYLRVGVFVNPSEEDLSETAQIVPLDVLQLHGDRYPTSFPKPYRIWRSIAPNAPASPDEPAVEAYLLDTPSPDYGGSGQTFNWHLAERHTSRIVLAGGLNSSNVAEAIRVAKPWGVDACSRLESTPGKKNAAEVRAFVRVALACFFPPASKPTATERARPSPSKL